MPCGAPLATSGVVCVALGDVDTYRHHRHRGAPAADHTLPPGPLTAMRAAARKDRS